MKLRTIHPRRPDWCRYQCDVCGETFWGLKDIPQPKGLPTNDQCAGCREMPQSLHFTTGRKSPEVGTDIQYHGGMFHRGEW